MKLIRNIKTVSLVLSVSAVVFLLNSCIDLESVNKFSTESAKAVKSSSQIDYSFAKSCQSFECQPMSVLLSSKQMPDVPSCNCDTFQMADKALLTLNTLISGYLNGLAQLSDKKTIDYNYEGLVSSLDTNMIRDKIKISSAQLKSAGKIAKIITDDIMDVYRKKKIKTVVQKSNDDFAKVIDAYISCMKNNFRNGLLENDKYRLKGRYNTYLMDNSALLTVEMKKKLFDDYIQKCNDLNGYQAQCDTYIKALQKIKEGHQEMFNNISKITEKQVQNALLGYASDIHSIYTEYNTNFKQVK